MALQKEITTQYGVSADYHKILELNIDWLKKSGSIVIGVFLDRQARLDGMSPMEINTFIIAEQYIDTELIPFPLTIEGKNVKEAYIHLKTLPDYTDAIDV